jgi:copper oxidase (laccase) domain-containing protein
MNTNETHRSDQLFDGAVNLIHTTTDFGVVHPKEPHFAERFGKILELTGQDRILAQKLETKVRTIPNTVVTPIGNVDELEPQEVAAGFLRTPEASDGVVVSITGETLLKIGVMIMTADCGVIKILAPNGELAVLHGGLNNVDNEVDGSSIVENAIAHFRRQGFHPGELRFQIGQAASGTAYGFDATHPKWMGINERRARSLSERYGNDVIQTIDPRLIRGGGIGFDVALIAARQAEQARIRDIEIDDLCVSTHGLAEAVMGEFDTYGDFYSNVRENPATLAANKYGSRSAAVICGA